METFLILLNCLWLSDLLTIHWSANSSKTSFSCNCGYSGPAWSGFLLFFEKVIPLSSFIDFSKPFSPFFFGSNHMKITRHIMIIVKVFTDLHFLVSLKEISLYRFVQHQPELWISVSWIFQYSTL